MAPTKKADATKKATFDHDDLHDWIEKQDIDLLAHASAGTEKCLRDKYMIDNDLEEVTDADKKELSKALIVLRNKKVGIQEK